MTASVRSVGTRGRILRMGGIHRIGVCFVAVMVAHAFLVCPAFAQATRTQAIQLRQGWNAVFLEVYPTNPEPAAVFLQTEVDAQGHPVRQEASTSFIGSFETAMEFGSLLRQEAQRRGTQMSRSLDSEKAEKEIGYFENNLERMTYGTFRKAGYFIGSRVVEAGCKTVVGKRMKCSGMFCSEAGGQGILDLRCALLSQRLDGFCQSRTAPETMPSTWRPEPPRDHHP
jgi:hypothetical protein